MNLDKIFVYAQHSIKAYRWWHSVQNALIKLVYFVLRGIVKVTSQVRVKLDVGFIGLAPVNLLTNWLWRLSTL